MTVCENESLKRMEVISDSLWFHQISAHLWPCEARLLESALWQWNQGTKWGNVLEEWGSSPREFLTCECLQRHDMICTWSLNTLVQVFTLSFNFSFIRMHISNMDISEWDCWEGMRLVNRHFSVVILHEHILFADRRDTSGKEPHYTVCNTGH